MKYKKLSIWVIFVLLAILILFIFFVFYQNNYGHKVVTDLWFEETNLKGLTKDEVKKILERKISEMEKWSIKFYFEQKEITISPIIIALADPDLTRQVINFNIEKTIENIFLFPQRINFFGFLKETEKQKIKLVVELKKDELNEILHSNFKEFEISPQDANLEYKNNIWTIKSEESGKGLDYQAAVQKLAENLANFDQSPIRLGTTSVEPNIYKKDVTLSLVEIEKILNNAPVTLSYGKDKWVIDKDGLRNWIILKKEDHNIVIDLDQIKIEEYLGQLALKINQPAQEAKFKIENDRVVEFQLAKEGRDLEVLTNALKIKDYVFSGIKEIGLEVVLTKPAVVNEDINDLGIIELVGRGESDFKGSPSNRIHNIKIGAKILNGILIKPGEEFSLLKALGEINESRGYLPELVIKGGRTIPELGGGLCQIATSAFRVAINAGVKITQRRPHAFRVIYYEPAGMDATIYNPWPDFKFINDFESWILLQTKIEGTKLIFEFFGTQDGRKVEITELKIFNVISPGPAIMIETEELAPGVKKQVEKAVAGANAEFTRIITSANGESQEETWESYYRPWAEVWLVGKIPTSENQELLLID